MEKICFHCTEPFETKSNKHYCSKECQVVASRALDWLKHKTDPRKRCKQLTSHARKRAKIKDLPFNIDSDYVYKLWEEQEGLCLVSGEEFNLSSPEKFGHCRWNAPSLDRITPELGYTKGNIRIVCYQINAALQHYGLDHFIDLCNKVTKNMEQ